MLRKIRLTLATIFFALITLLFLDFTGTIHAWLGWMAKIQFVPALLAGNLVVLFLLMLLTLGFGRVYCSVICPLGVMQDIISWFGGKAKRNRFNYTKPLNWLRYSLLAIFAVSLFAGVASIFTLIAPYSSFGRIAGNLFAPLYGWGNNLLAYFAERADSYAFYTTDVYIKSLPVFVVALVTFIIIAVLAFRGGRTYCNTICPVGTFLGLISRNSWFKPVIDTAKCNGCTACARRCKASCINAKEHEIDYSRCVACMDCISNCKQGAISYKHVSKESKAAENNAAKDSFSIEGKSADNLEAAVQPVYVKANKGRRGFLAATAMLATSAVLKAQDEKLPHVDGGLADITDKKEPKRAAKIVPPGALSVQNMERHCIGCQLCVEACPNGVLRPSTGLMDFAQPYSSYEKGYCRPECTECSNVCPAGAIKPIDVVKKSSIQIGRAVWVRELCLPVAEGVKCGNCARHCPAGAIQMVTIDGHDCNGENHNREDGTRTLKIPVVNAEKCIGCGACENLCPARPLSAIYVEGNEVHRDI